MRVFSITLVVAQLAVSLFLVGWVLANAGLLRGPLAIVGVALVVLTILAVMVRIWAAGKRAPEHSLTDENS